MPNLLPLSQIRPTRREPLHSASLSVNLSSDLICAVLLSSVQPVVYIQRSRYLNWLFVCGLGSHTVTTARGPRWL